MPGYNKYARLGDYCSAQLSSVKSHGYGLYLAKFQPAQGPTCSTFWLYADAPAVAFLPNTVQNWRWNEIDFEWVPETQTQQNQYSVIDGTQLGKSSPVSYGTRLDLTAPAAQSIGEAAINWVQNKIQTDNTIARDMWDYYNTWMTASDNGAPTGGTFTVTDATTGASTGSLAPGISASGLLTGLDALNGGQGLFKLKGQYTVSVTAVGGPGSIESGQSVITGLAGGLWPQIAPGMTVTCPGNPSAIAAGTVVTGVAASGVTISKPALADVTKDTFNFTPMGSFSINFPSTALSGNQYITCDTTSLTPYSLAKAIYTEAGSGTNLQFSVFQPQYAPANPADPDAWWQLLVDQTGSGLAWPSAQTWKYPLCKKETPTTLEKSKMTTINFWRSPGGNESATLDFGSWGTVDHKGVLYQSPIPGSPVPGSFQSATLANETFVFGDNNNFDPFSDFYTYLIVWTPTRMAQFILPKDFDPVKDPASFANAKPVAEFDLTDFPSLDMSGTQAPGGDIPWMGRQLEEAIDTVSINFANYFAFTPAGSGSNNPTDTTGDLTKGDAILTNVASAQIFVGQEVVGTGVPGGTTVSEIVPSLVLSQSAPTATGVALTLSVTVTGDIGGTEVSNIDTTRLYTGMTVSGAGVSANTLVQSIDSVGAAGTLTLSQSAQNKTGAGLTFSFSATGDVSGTTVQNLKNVVFNQLWPNFSITGGKIPSGTKVLTVSSKVTMNQGATATQTGVSLTFQSREASAGWSGFPPGSSFDSCDAYVRSISFFPLINNSGTGSKMSDFNTTKGKFFSLDFSGWTADQFNTDLTKYFAIQFNQGYTSIGAVPDQSPLRDTQSPLNVSLVQHADGKNAMRLRAQKSSANPARNFFRFSVSAPSGSPTVSSSNPLVWASISNATGYCSTNSFAGTPTAFFAPQKQASGPNSATVQINAYKNGNGYYPKGSTPTAPDATATLKLTTASSGAVSWTVVSDTKQIMLEPSAQTPYDITVNGDASKWK